MSFSDYFYLRYYYFTSDLQCSRRRLVFIHDIFTLKFIQITCKSGEVQICSVLGHFLLDQAVVILKSEYKMKIFSLSWLKLYVSQYTIPDTKVYEY